ncbi:MAG: ABC transporter permease [Coriobacteriales bacterium]|jgi:putative spermidine/putrescine transport system permease protein
MRLSGKTRHALAPYVLIAPACVLLAIFVYGVVNGVMQGFGIMPFLGMTTPTLKYYLAALTRPDLVSSILYSLYLAAASSILAAIGGVILSAVLTSVRAGRITQLIALQIPIMSAHMLVAIAAVSLFTATGLFARVLNVFGLGELMANIPPVIGSTEGWGIIFVYLWKEIPFIAFFTVTLMMGISEHLGEAARSLGASPARTFFNVTLPLCRSTILKAFLIVFAFALGSYEIPYLLGPTLPKTLPVLAYIEFQDPDLVNRCYSMALNGIMTFICAALALVYFIVLQREKKVAR